MCEPSSDSYTATVFETGTPGNNNRDCIMDSGNVTKLTMKKSYVKHVLHPIPILSPFLFIPICLLFKACRIFYLLVYYL